MTQFQSHFNHSNLIELPQALVPLENYTTVYSDNMALEALYLGMLSLCLSLINIANIIIGALLLLKVQSHCLFFHQRNHFSIRSLYRSKR